MLQWMGGARRKMKATKNERLKRQQEYFDLRKEKQRKMELGEETGKAHTLADYIRQNLHGGESLDILGLRSLNPTPDDVDTAAHSDASLPDPATAPLKPEAGDSAGVNPATSSASAYSAESDIKSRGIDREPEKEIKCHRPCTQRTPGGAAPAQQGIDRHVNRQMEISSPGKRRNPIHVGNLQTKKVASTPRLKLLGMISDEDKDTSCDKRRLPSESYAFLSEDGNDAFEGNVFEQGAQHPQEKFLTSESVADCGGTKHPFNSSLPIKNRDNSCPGTLVTGTTNLLTKFLSTQKLKSFRSPSAHQPHEHNVTKDQRVGTESALNSLRVTHNRGHDPTLFSDPTVNTTNAKAKISRKTSFSRSFLDMEYFRVKQDSQKFEISDPFVNTMNNLVKQERLEYGYLNRSINIYDHELTHDYPFLQDLSFARSTFECDIDLIDQENDSFSPENDSITWKSDISLTLPNFKRECRNLDHFWSIQVPSYDRSECSSRQFGAYDEFEDMSGDFYPSVGYREISDVRIDKLLLPMDDFGVERQHVESGFSSRDDFSSRRRTNQRNSEEETFDGNEDRRKRCAFFEDWKCDLSATWDVPWHQENIDSAQSGQDSDQTHKLNSSNSWSQTVDGGMGDHGSDYPARDMDVVQAGCLPSEAQATIGPDIFQDLKPLLLPPINNGDEDFIIVCFPDKKECPTVKANSFPPPTQPCFPLLELGTEKSSAGLDHDINVLSCETCFNRISQETDDFLVSGRDITTVEATTSTNTKLISARESSCERILKRSRQSQLDYPLHPYTASSCGRSSDVIAWHLRAPQRETRSELLSFPTSRRSFSDYQAKDKEETIEGGLETNVFSNDRVDQCVSSNVLNSYPSKHGMTRNIQGNSVETCSSMRNPEQGDTNGMSTTEAEPMPRKQLWIKAGVAYDTGIRAPFSSQEECSPAGQLNKVQNVLCKFQNPAFSNEGTKDVDNVLLKLVRPSKYSTHGLRHQDAEANQTVKQTSEMYQSSNAGSETKSTAECRARLLTYSKTSGSGESFSLPNASKTIILSSKEGEDRRALSEVSTLRIKESKLSLDDIDAIASRFSNQPYQTASQSKAQSLPSLVRIKKVADSSGTRAGDAKQYSTPVSQRNPVSEVPNREQPSQRDSGGLEIPSNAPQASEKQATTSEEQEGCLNIQHKLNITQEHFQVGGSSTTSYDAAAYMKILEGPENNQHSLPVSAQHSRTVCDSDYVQMLESYVVQLKLENNTLRLWTDF